jgi:hypothetical protein
MKKVVLLLGVCAMSLNLSFGQLSVTPNPVSFIVNDFDLSDEWAEAVAHGDLTNEFGEEVQVKWEAELIDAPADWELKICDKNTCYGSNVTSNIDPDIGLNEPVVLASGETALLDTHVLPKGIAGCAKVTIQLSLVDDPGNILETVNYDYEVNVNGDCSAVSVVNVSKAQASVYPNPVQGEFFLRNPEQQVKSIRLFNLMGKELKYFQAGANRSYSVNDLAQGIYFVQLLDANDKLIKTSKINKQ